MGPHYPPETTSNIRHRLWVPIDLWRGSRGAIADQWCSSRVLERTYATEEAKRMRTRRAGSASPRPAAIDAVVRRRLLQGTPWSMLGLLVSTFGVLATSALLARLLTPANLGAFYLVLSTVTITAVVAKLGLSQLVVRLTAGAIAQGRPGLARGIIRSVAIVGTLFAAVCGAALALGIGPLLARQVLHSAPIAGVMLLAGAWIFSEALRTTFAETFRGFHEIARATLFGDAFRTLTTLTVLGLVFASSGVVALGWAVSFSLLASWIALVVAAIALWRRARRLGAIEPFAPTSLIRPGVTLMMVELAAILVNQTDLWVVGAYGSTRDVALYGAALRLGFLAVVPLLIVNGVVPPIIAELHVQGRHPEMERTLRSTAALATVPSLVSLVALGLFGHELLGLVFGTFYEGAFVLLVVLAAGQAFGVLMGSCGVTLMMAGEGSALLRVSLLAALGTVALEIVMVGRFGTVGVAIASSIGLAAQNLALVLVIRQRFGIWTPADLSPAGFRQIAQIGRKGQTP